MILSHPYPGFLIAIEGIDGAGKTTQAHFVQAALQARGLEVVRAKEPTTGPWGQILRDSALTGRLGLEEEIQAFINDRTEHVATVIRPALEAGKFVILDRYYFSSVAYQGARGADPAEIVRRNETFAIQPDLLVVLDIDPELGLERVRMRGDRANLFEQTNALVLARAIFLGLDKPYLYKLDGLEPPETLCAKIVRQISAVFVEKIAQSEAPLRDKLQSTLRLFGSQLALSQ